MTRRSTPQAKIDDSAFPVRLLICVPEMGLGSRSDALHEWLATRIGRGNYAWHAGGRGGTRDRIALYFREPDSASACLTAFPDLELADGTCLPGYSSPFLPFGRSEDDDTVCNLYNQTTTQEAMRQLFKGLTMTDRAGNVAAGKVYPDQLAPIIRHDGNSLELVKARWGMPSPPSVLKTQRDPGVTNVRNLTSPHWRRWLGPAHRCLVPGAGHGFRRADQGWKSVVRPGGISDPNVLRRDRGPGLEVGPKGEGRRNDRRSLCLSDLRAQCRGEIGASESHAGHSERSPGLGDLAFGAN